MNDFDYDVMQKKRIARGAAARKIGSKSRKCTLPSDYLTAAQKKARNGKMSTYNLNRPMSFAEFRAMPEDLQHEYATKLRDKYHASLAVVATMFGVAPETVRTAFNLCGVNTSVKMIMSREQAARWNEWLASASEAEAVEETPEPEAETEAETEDKVERLYVPQPRRAEMLRGSFTMTGTAAEILRRLAVLMDTDSDQTLMATFAFKGKADRDE